MSNTVSWNLTADETRFLQGCLKAHNALSKVGDAGRTASTQTRSGFDDALGSVTKFAGALGLITTATGAVVAIANQLKAEYEHLVTRQREAAMAQMAVGESRAAALMNKPADMNTAWLDSFVKQIAATEQVDQKRLWRVAGNMLSAKGPLSNEAFAQAFRETARVGALAGEGIDLPTLGGGLMDVMRVAGVQSAPQAGGWIKQYGQQARIVDLDKQIRSLIPAISASKAFGWTPEQGAEFTAFLTQMSGDTEGRKSSSGAVGFMEQLDAARTAGGAIIPERGAFGKLRFKPLQSKGVDAIKELQDWYASADESLREEFRAKLQGEKKVKGGLLSLIARDPQALAAYAEVQKQITDPKAAGVGENWSGYFKDVAKDPNESVRAVQRALATAKEGVQLGDATAMGGVSREGLSDLLGSIPGVSDAYRKIAMLEFELRTSGGQNSPIEAIVGALEKVRSANAPFEKHKVGLLGIHYGAVENLLEIPEGFVQTGPGEWTRGNEEINTRSNYVPGLEDSLSKAIESLRKSAQNLEDATKANADAAKSNADEARRPRPGSQVGD